MHFSLAVSLNNSSSEYIDNWLVDYDRTYKGKGRLKSRTRREELVLQCSYRLVDWLLLISLVACGQGRKLKARVLAKPPPAQPITAAPFRVIADCANSPGKEHWRV